MPENSPFGDRNLPYFDNHYNSGVLIDNWRDNRIYEADGRAFTLAVDHTTGPSLSMYKSDFTDPGEPSVQPMMRRRGLGKELMFSNGNSMAFDGAPTSSQYGASQRHMIDTKYGKPASSRLKTDGSTESAELSTFAPTTSVGTTRNKADDNPYANFCSTKAIMDLTVACHQFQRQIGTNNDTHTTAAT
ncbi:hypothetical protein DQ04_00671160 [Trypanosoma grayi]|uniref:hypothetical protein n=1 Tax=Trypanosoma grayi TaxID=71804 RepID=UPI0004F4B71D|nr:hypothetical protein DQ04_00671160 [Trypanosoma grayi]KEG14013.1 hypothetical protein DQ04_00671160 [Trypanosoma grayi]